MTITVDSLTKEFNVPGGIEVAVDNINLEIGEEEFLTLVGPSGCGKSTTLRCIAGLETPTAGTIRFNGEEVTEVPSNRRNIAMMFQDIALYPHMSIRANIAYPLKVRDTPRAVRDEEAQEAAELLQIEELLDKYPNELSGGQQQRAALARTLVQDPVLFLMDEPLSDLDANLKVEIRKEIQRVHNRVRRPTIYVTHDQEEAMTMSDRIAVMNDGQIEQVGTPNELYYTPANRFVATFIGNPNMNFLEGSIVDIDDERVKVTIDDLDFTLETSISGVQNEPPSSEIALGYRPEAVQIGDNVETPDFEAEVILVEQTGDRLMVTAETESGEEIRIITAVGSRPDEGETAPISIDRERVHLFDLASGEIIANSEHQDMPVSLDPEAQSAT